MAYHLINDHLVEVPADMSVSIATHLYPGDNDAIIYRGIEIATCDTDEPEGTPYMGLFVIAFEHKDWLEVLNLDEARAAIDAEMRTAEFWAIISDELGDKEPVKTLLVMEDDDLGFSAVM